MCCVAWLAARPSSILLGCWIGHGERVRVSQSPIEIDARMDRVTPLLDTWGGLLLVRFRRRRREEAKPRPAQQQASSLKNGGGVQRE